MTALIAGALIAALALSAALAAMLFWQLKRSSKAVDGHVAGVQAAAELQILLAAAQVALTDKERALNIVIAERDRLEFTVDTVEEQRDLLLEEALEHATPGTVAVSVRNALNGLRVLDSEEASNTKALPDVPSGANGND